MNFTQLKAFHAEPLLNPQGLAVDVSKLPQSLSAGRPYRRRAVCPDTQGQFNTQVLHQGLVPQTYAGCADNSVEFRFAAAQGHAGLRG